MSTRRSRRVLVRRRACACHFSNGHPQGVQSCVYVLAGKASLAFRVYEHRLYNALDGGFLAALHFAVSGWIQYVDGRKLCRRQVLLVRVQSAVFQCQTLKTMVHKRMRAEALVTFSFAPLPNSTARTSNFFAHLASVFVFQPSAFGGRGCVVLVRLHGLLLHEPKATRDGAAKGATVLASSFGVTSPRVQKGLQRARLSTGLLRE